MATVELADEAATLALGMRLANELRSGDLVALEGELGAGKTTLVRGLAAGLGIDASLVSSPTFVTRQDYAGPRVSLVHIDAWRIESAETVESLGLDELAMPGANCVVVVEWISRIAKWIAAPTLSVRLELTHDGAQRRASIGSAPPTEPD